MNTDHYRPAQAGDLYEGRRVFCHYVGDPTTPTADSLGTVVELRPDGWHTVQVDSGRLYTFNHERLAVALENSHDDDEWPGPAEKPELFHLPETIDEDEVWQQDAQHGPYVAESTPDGTVARVVHIPSPYSTERRTVEAFLCDDAWQQAMAAAWRYYRNERATYAGGR